MAMDDLNPLILTASRCGPPPDQTAPPGRDPEYEIRRQKATYRIYPECVRHALRDGSPTGRLVEASDPEGNDNLRTCQIASPDREITSVHRRRYNKSIQLNTHHDTLGIVL